MSLSSPTLPRRRAGRATTERERRSAGERLRAVARGREGDPAWVRPALLGVLALAAVLCLWNLSRNGYSNEYYAAAAKSGSESWKAWFFGSLDPGSFITVDKPPLSLWLMGLSTRAFGFSSFSMLLPEALSTIAAVGLLYATIRRLFGPAAGLVGAALLALTPITIAIGRVNNPDALLILLLVASAYLVVRALESGRGKHLAWAGALVGLAFMTKMLQGWMVVPALGGVYLLAGPPRLLVRVRQLAVAGAAMVAVSAAWPLAVTLWPGSKPYIGGSEDGSIWNLILGYNGFGRLTGNESGMGGGGGSPTFGGAAGIGRMFNSEVGAQIAWLLPLAAVSLVAGLWITRRAGRRDLRRAGLVLFGLWAIVHVLVFSTAKGIFHPYYVSALAPAVAALSGVGLVLLWQQARRSLVALAMLDAVVVGTAVLAVVLLGRTPDFLPALRVVIPVAAGLAVVGSLALRFGVGAGSGSGSARRWLAPAVAVLAAVAVAAGPGSYAFANLGHALNGNNVLAGPTGAGSGGGGFGGGGAPGGGGAGRGGFARGGTPPSGAMPSGTRPTGTAGARVSSGDGRSGAAGGASGGGMGGSVSTSVIRYLEANQGSAKYLFAASGSQTTASVIISTGKPVVTIGGFSGSDAAPTVSQLAQMVKSGQLKYVLLSSAGGGGRGAPGGGSSTDLATWVKAHGKAVTAVTVSSGTLYEVSA